ncbi:MAG: HAMP domain-containing sensor histidine kinase [Thermoanaerobaculia bacterium]|nr:HAMP domain-containing sensor histidine kinase [Thermoanaerobaculia bacterium]
MSDDRKGLRPSGDLELDLLIHEIKGPVAVADAAMSSLLEREDRYGSLTERQAKTLRRALRGVRRTQDLIHSLLELGRAEAGQFGVSDFDLATVIEGLVFEALEATDQAVDDWPELDDEGRRAALAAAGVELAVGDGGPLEVRHDRVKLSQMVGNLVRNAIKAREGRLRVEAGVADGKLRIVVEDDGPGIPDDQRESVFGRYVRAKSADLGALSGHGLGLAGVRYLARLMGGDVSLGAGDEGGARFEIEVPAVLASPGAEAADATQGD